MEHCGRKILIKSFNNCKFKKLEILEFLDGKNESFVTFKATIFCEEQDSSLLKKVDLSKTMASGTMKVEK
jgi:hypothetical protein